MIEITTNEIVKDIFKTHRRAIYWPYYGGYEPFIRLFKIWDNYARFNLHIIDEVMEACNRISVDSTYVYEHRRMYTKLDKGCFSPDREYEVGRVKFSGEHLLEVATEIYRIHKQYQSYSCYDYK